MDQSHVRPFMTFFLAYISERLFGKIKGCIRIAALEVLCGSLTIHIHTQFSMEHPHCSVVLSRSTNYLQVSRVFTIKCLTRPKDGGPQACTVIQTQMVLIPPSVLLFKGNDWATHWAGRSNEHDKVLSQQAEDTYIFQSGLSDHFFCILTFTN